MMDHMDEEIEGAEPEEFLTGEDTMTQESFSFFDVLEERTYPKDVVHIYMDEGAAYELDRLSREADTMEVGEDGRPSDEDLKHLNDEYMRLSKRIEDSKYTLYLTGVSDDRIEDAQLVAQEHFEPKKKQRKTASGTIEKYLPEAEQLNFLRYFNAAINALHIERIFRHKDGRWMVAPGADEIAYLYDKAPASEKEKLNTAIQALRVKSTAFERKLDEGFLAKS